MKNTKNTRVQKQQKKAKKQRRISSTLMCGLVLSGVALPAVAVLADNAIQSQTPASTQSSTVKTAQDTPAPVVANPDSGKDGSAEFAPPLDSADPNTPAPTLSPETPAPTTKQATEKHKAIIHFVNSVSGESIKADMTVEGTVEQDIRSVAGKDAFKVPGYVLTEEPNTFYPFNANWVQEYTAFYTPEGYEAPDDGFVLGTDGYYHQKHDNGEINYNVRFADFNITYVDKATGKTLGTDAQGIKEAGTGTSSTTYGHGFSENTWAIADGDSKWIDSNSSFDYDGKTYYSGIYVYTDRSQDGSTGDVVSPVNGQINVTVPLTDITKTDPAENVTFKTRYVDDATGKDIAPSSTDTLPVGSSYSATALDIPHYKLNSAKDVNFTVQKGQEDVIFHYTKDQESFVEFKLVDAKTNKEIGKSVKRSGQEGQWTSIDPTSKEFKIDGYTMQKSYYQTPGLGTQTYDFPEPGKTNSVTVKYDKDSDKPVAKEGTLTVRYTDISGNEIKESTTQKGKVGDLYEVVAPDIKGWKLSDNSPNLFRDEYKEGNTTVTFKYDKDETPDPVAKSTITVKYVDEKGTEIQKSTSKQGNSGDKFQMSAKELEIKGYDLKSKAIDTTFGDKDQTITVEYTKHVDPVKQGSVTFKYVDKDSKELQASKTVKGDVDKAFEEKAPTIEGYSLDKSKSDETYSGKFTEQGQTFTFVYNKDVTPTPDPQPQDSKLRPVLEQAIKDAKPYSDKAKYQAKYVDALDKAISDAEAFLKANPAPQAKARALKVESTDLDTQFQAQIDSVTTAVNNVTANPVTPKPDEDIVKITFNLYDMNDKDKDGNLKLLKTVVLDASKKEIDANGGLWDATKHKDELAVDGYTYVSGLGTLMEIDTHGAPNEFPVLYAKNTPNPTPDPVKQGSVTFKYVDKDSKELQASKTIKGDVGKAFEEKAPSIKGYKLDTTKSEETYKGKYTELGQTYYFVYVGDGSTPSNDPSHKDDNNNTSDNNNTPSDNKDSNNESGKTVPPTAPKGSYYDDNGNLLNKDGVLIDSKGTPLTSDQSKNTLKVDNTKNKTGLPETGESSTLLMMLSGLGVLMASVLAFIVKRKPKRD
ncbi:MucBP domain-containing protein [Lactococcus lactis]|uniref:MucBP domain-containing protein n=1 Tax=Lactococcus lactis TaxID=1358 RepID=UPI002891BEB6|nr:MucBP domain-containing protein [Lactococcus lactis]MDT2884265.1 MucBP domain-containing protein [Lactococcus lactis]MDT2921894.1 MucBP domain-containing protein [Lactococcus lactis]MDT2939391.1 MucBP domain-containing protein [Lactococcus lactis]MDT2970318.1 MucBP domain-containing protein [Lactococcus lactis]